jgi:hypothetical protein
MSQIAGQKHIKFPLAVIHYEFLWVGFIL